MARGVIVPGRGAGQTSPTWHSSPGLLQRSGAECFLSPMVAVPGGVDCGLDRILLWSGLSIEHCFACIAGGEYIDQESAALDGVHWRVPMLIEVDAFVNSLGEVVTYLEKEFPITGKLHFSQSWNCVFSMVSRIWKLSLKPSLFIN